MADYAIAIISGRMAQDPVEYATQSGSKVYKFSVASRKRFAKNNETSFYDCVSWGDPNVLKYRKGDYVLVTGDLAIEQYTKKDGTTAKIVQLSVTDIRWNSPLTKEDAEKRAAEKKSKEAEEAVNISPADDDDDDSLPF